MSRLRLTKALYANPTRPYTRRMSQQVADDAFARLRALAVRVPDKISLSNEQHLELIRKMADRLIEREPLEALRALEKHSAGLPIAAAMAAKLALSRATLRGLDPAVHLSVVFAVYKEHQRILRPTVAGFRTHSKCPG